MMDLIGTLEQATEGNSELNALVAIAIGWRCQHGEDVPPYTTSLDAALTLVPEGWTWAADGGDKSNFSLDDIRPAASVWRRGSNPYVGDECFAATPALALCIAALKARQADKPGGE